MNKFKLFIFSLILSISYLPVTHSAPLAHVANWKRMPLPHFDLIYDKENQDLASLYAIRLETAYNEMSKHFLHMPKKTVVVLNDNTDLTNGYANNIPYPLIMLYPVYPRPGETIGEFGDWEQELILHEFTHILSLEPKRGFIKFLHSIFGSIVTPNMLLPRWWLEGIAVDTETRFSKFGRLRSSLQDASIRAIVRENKWSDFSLADINEIQNPVWPYGGRPYLFGSLMWSEMIAMTSYDSVAQLHERSAGRVPYFINAPANDIFGTDYSGIYKKAATTQIDRAEHQLELLRSTSTTQSETIGLPGIEQFAPTISPDGLKLAYIEYSDATRRSIRILVRPNVSVPFDRSQLIGAKTNGDRPPEPDAGGTGPKLPYQIKEDGPPTGSITRVSWLPDSQRFVYDKVSEVDDSLDASDLYLYNFVTGKTVQLSHGLRAREPAVSPDGKLVAFVGLDAGRTHLGVLSIISHKSRILVKSALQERVSNPSFVAKNEIIYSLRKNGIERVMKMSGGSSTGPTEIKFNLKNIHSLEPHNADLYFTSTQNGANNIYYSNAKHKSVVPITNTETGVESFTIDHAKSEIYFTELHANGVHLVRTPLNTQLTNPLPKIEPLAKDRYPGTEMNAATLDPFTPEDFTSARYMWPTYWFPYIVTDPKGTYYSVQTSGSDPVGRHAYTIFAYYDSYIKRASYDFSYIYSLPEPKIIFSAQKTNAYLIDNLTTTESEIFSLNSVWQLASISPNWYSSIGALSEKKSSSFVIKESQLAGPTAGVSYSNISQAGREISPESGRLFSLNGNFFLPSGDNDHFNRYTLNYSEFFSRWLPRHHAFMTRLQGDYIDQNVSITHFNSSSALLLKRDINIADFTVRGYPNGTFLAKSHGLASFEYRFPIIGIHHGWGTTPFYLQRLHGALVVDGVAADGYAYNQELSLYSKIKTNKMYWGVGAEIHLDVTLGYYLPISFYSGVYWPTEKQFAEKSAYTVFGLSI